MPWVLSFGVQQWYNMPMNDIIPTEVNGDPVGKLVRRDTEAAHLVFATTLADLCNTGGEDGLEELAAEALEAAGLNDITPGECDFSTEGVYGESGVLIRASFWVPAHWAPPGAGETLRSGLLAVGDALPAGKTAQTVLHLALDRGEETVEERAERAEAWLRTERDIAGREERPGDAALCEAAAGVIAGLRQESITPKQAGEQIRDAVSP